MTIEATARVTAALAGNEFGQLDRTESADGISERGLAPLALGPVGQQDGPVLRELARRVHRLGLFDRPREVGRAEARRVGRECVAHLAVAGRQVARQELRRC